MWVLIWIQTAWLIDSVPESIFENTNFEKKSADDNTEALAPFFDLRLLLLSHVNP